VPPVFYPSLYDRPREGGLSLTGYMALLIAVIMLPMLALVTIVAWDYGTAARRTIEAQRLDVANNIKILIGREIDQTAGFLGGITTSAQGLRTSRPDVVARVSAQASARGFASLIVYDPDGVPTAASAEAAQHVPAASVGLAEIKAGARFFVSNLIADAGPRPGLYFVSVPFVVDGKVVAMLAGGLQPRRLQRLLFEAGLREGWQAGIVDRNAILLARDRLPEMYVGVVAHRRWCRRCAAASLPACSTWSIGPASASRMRSSARRPPAGRSASRCPRRSSMRRCGRPRSS
jgi:hypothetical protein